MPNLLIIGGGYAGLWAAMAAARRADENGSELHIRLLSKDAYLTHRPRLYERNPQDMRTPLGPVLEPIGVDLALGEVTAIEPAARTARATDAEGNSTEYIYDGLVLAAGSILRPPPLDIVDGRTWSVDDYQSAVALDQHLQARMAEPAEDAETVVIIGAGFTGIELAAEMRTRLAAHGGTARAEKARVILLDAAATVSEDLGPGPRPHILEALQAARVEVRLNTTVRRIKGDQVMLDDGGRITCQTVIVTTGAQASPLAAGFGLATDPAGRLFVDEFLRVKGLANIHAAGDIAHAMTDDSHASLMSCQHAMPMGKAAGYNAASDLLDLPPLPYQQTRYVTCLDLGPWGAVFSNGWERQVEMIKDEAKARKQFVMTQVIYPPTKDRAAILEAGALG
ncbi:MAG: FAD-dependent oxidoreductase [Alphaproteobacteria bacterium]|nr:FAD-dependent oxidoreductase [Alphaproteobacteria bacterium]